MTYYEKLGITKNATQEEIKEAYKNLIKRYHPDVYQGDKTYAEKMTKEINVAYDILSDPLKKAEYDEEINPTPSYNSQYNYDYTPPKYDTPPSNYNDYRQSYSKDYNYNYRYTNYHRNKTPNSSYTENSPLENKFINIFDTNKTVIVILIVIIYIALLIFTFCEFYAFKTGSYTGTVTNVKKVEENNTSSYKDEPYVNEDIYSFPSKYEDFDVNDYVSDADLYNIYLEYYSEYYESFSEFKEDFSKELFEYYSQFY